MVIIHMGNVYGVLHKGALVAHGDTRAEAIARGLRVIVLRFRNATR